MPTDAANNSSPAFACQAVPTSATTPPPPPVHHVQNYPAQDSLALVHSQQQSKGIQTPAAQLKPQMTMLQQKRQLPIHRPTGKVQDEDDDRDIRPPGPQLPTSYQFRDKDVCSGRGKKNWNLPGNVKYRQFIQDRVGQYIAASSKRGKTLFIMGLVRELRADGYQFLKEDRRGILFDMGDKEAREKVAHSLRDQVTALKQKAAIKKKLLAARANAYTPSPQFLTYPNQHFVTYRPSVPDGTLIDYWIELE